MTRTLRLEISFITLFGIIFVLQGCGGIGDITGTYRNEFNGDKLTLNKDGTSFTVKDKVRTFEGKYRVEGNKIFLQEYLPSSPNIVTKLTLAPEINERLCIVEPKYPTTICYAKEK